MHTDERMMSGMKNSTNAQTAIRTTITGWAALAAAQLFDACLSTHADPTAPARSEVSLADAAQIAAQDPRLVYLSTAELAYVVRDDQILALRAEAATAGDVVQRIICDMAHDGEDSQYDAECLDADGRPDYSGGGHDPATLARIRAALRLTEEQARAACAVVIAEAAAQS